jgi:hypothetical protein
MRVFFLRVLLACAVTAGFFSTPSFAGRDVSVMIGSSISGGRATTCEAVFLTAKNALPYGNTASNPTCTNFDYCVLNAASGAWTSCSSQLIYSTGDPYAPTTTKNLSYRHNSGSCIAGQGAVDKRVAIGYYVVDSSPLQEVQHIQNVTDIIYTKDACKFAVLELLDCFFDTTEVAENVALHYCSATFAETGEKGGGDTVFDENAVPPYTGTGYGGGSGGDPGTCGGEGQPACGGDTGGGDTGECGGEGQPACDTGGGDTGGGDTGGGDTGGGDTGGGDTGGGDTGGGDTGGDTGDGSSSCGGEGQPACNTSIDESGTGTGVGAYNESDGAMLGAIESMEEGITFAQAQGNKDTSWKFSFNLPSGCVPLDVYLGVAVDPCQWQSKIHALMSMLWIMTTIGYCIHTVGATVSRGQS